MKRKYLFIIQAVIVAVICFVHALSAGHNVEFLPTNGTFQNFNPVRRLLAGQIPYGDFQDYLGMGHLFSGSLFTRLFGGDYRASLIAFSFLQFLSLGLIALMIGIAVFKDKKTAGAVTTLILTAVLLRHPFIERFLYVTEDIRNALEASLGPGNSVRFIRAMILPLAVFMLLAGYRLYMRAVEKGRISEHAKLWIALAGIGVIAGAAFLWSNDYGISCWLCLMISTFFLCLSRMRKFWKPVFCTIYVAAISVIAIVGLAAIVTGGHPMEWVLSTFGTGGYQSWYYNSPKSYYIYDIDISLPMQIQAGIAVAYFIMLFIRRASTETIFRYWIPGFANMVCFCAVNEYKLMSGGDAREVALSVLYLTILYEVVAFLIRKIRLIRIERFIVIASMAAAVVWIGFTVKEEIAFNNKPEKDGVYIEALGGNLINYATDLQAADEFLDGESFWATYASAQEVVSDTFQPSGTDYIIHVLGDRQREDYLKGFNNDDFRYAVTLRKEFSDWEYWNERANWFFYRELYQNWHPVFANYYELYWERNTGETDNFITEGYEIATEDIDESTRKIIVRSDKAIDGIADVYLDYEVKEKESENSLFLIRSMLNVMNSGIVYAVNGQGMETNNLRQNSAEHIPIPVVDGYGEVTITAEPRKNVYVLLNDCRCDGIFTVRNDYMTIEDISEDRTGIIVSDYANRLKRLNRGDEIKVYDDSYHIKELTEDDNTIYITVDEAVKDDIGRGDQLCIPERKD